ncbi:MAG: tetratricopeptide repeat protein [Candidatus Marinimicrobia bacterium]|nr:tetratricopeptide repeat protein [Candidatus Neomarinimicrobiota bacterium]
MSLQQKILRGLRRLCSPFFAGSIKSNWLLLLIAASLISLSACAGSGASKQTAESPDSERSKTTPSKSYNSMAIKHYMDGVNAGMQGDHALAIVEFQEALRYDSTSSTIYLDLSNSYIKLQKYDQAERILKLGLEKSDETDKLYPALGEVYYATSQYERAAQMFEKSLQVMEQEQDRLQALNYLGDIYLRLQDYRKAAETYEQLYRISYDQDEYLLKAQSIYYQIEDFDKVKETLRTLIKDNPETDDYRLDLAQLYSETGQIDSARTILEPLVKQDPTSNAASMLGEQLFQIGEIDSAYAILKPLYEADSSNVRVLYYLGGAALSNQDFELAEKYYSRLIESDDSILGGYYGLGVAQRGQEDFQESAEAIQDGLEKFPDEPELHKQLGITYFFMQNYDSARTSLLNALEYDSTQISPKHYLAFSYDQLGKPDSAIVMYKQLLEAVPNDPLYKNNLAYIYAIQDKNLKQAVKLVNEALDADPENASYLDTKGWVFYKLGKYQQAREYIEKALAIDGENAEVLEHLGDIYKKLGQNARAQDYYQRASQLDPENTALQQKLE